jgi:hypothetical protein
MSPSSIRIEVSWQNEAELTLVKTVEQSWLLLLLILETFSCFHPPFTFPVTAHLLSFYFPRDPRTSCDQESLPNSIGKKLAFYTNSPYVLQSQLLFLTCCSTPLDRLHCD